MDGWNPWHGCHKISEGCRHCYVYRIDGRHGRDSSVVVRNRNFDLPLRRNRQGEWKIPSGSTLFTCFSSDFFVEEADEWRPEAWEIIRQRPDVHFFIVTKRIDRLAGCIPPDWGEGYENVTICCTVENQDRADYRMPIYVEAPVRHKIVICEPLLGPIDLSPWLGPDILEVSVGGESGADARPCRYDWVLGLRQQCIDKDVPFRFRQTGARLVKDGKLYRIPRRQQHSQARRAGIDYK